ncbi:putative sugar O-methyltransferase [Nonomuraea sp. NPDC049655]|uniref:putative sugar O-methyltransferase n=1 Tax=Nonomuraea sp. NPDC049655 TaxID=3364355 RepID=UPI00378ECD02
MDRILRAFGYRLYMGPAHGRGMYVGPISGRYDPGRPPPPEMEAQLHPAHPRLCELRERYRRLDSPLTDHTVWTDEHRRDGIDLRHFRGDNAYVWQLRYMGRRPARKYRAYADYVRGLDRLGLLDRTEEDGAFGCWVFDDGQGRPVSRDLLDSINELYFLDRTWGLFDRVGFTVADIGAGYGRLAVRMASCVPGLRRYLCLDAIPESTFLSELYVRFRGSADRVLVVPLDEVDQCLAQNTPDLAVAVHSFSEMSSAAIDAWIARLASTGVKHLFVISNEADEIYAADPGRRRNDAMPILDRHGYRLTVAEPILRDEATRQVVGSDNHFLLFELGEA